MRRLILIAIRNVLRNRRRSLLAGLSMVVGVGVVVFLSGFFNGFIERIIRNTVEATVGAVQVHRKGFLDATQDPLKLDMPESFAETIRAVPGVKAVTPRINFEGMVNNGTSSTVFAGTAIDPAREYQVCPKRNEVEVPAGLGVGDEAAVLLGDALAASMDLKIGDAFSLLSATPRGSSNALDVTMKGAIVLNVPFASKRLLVAPLAFAQRLLRMEGRVTEFAVGVDKISDVDAVAARLGEKLGPDYEVLTWAERDRQAAQFVGRLRIILGFITVVLFVLIASGIVNTMLMAVYERVREIGTMLAVGVKRRQVLTMFLIEAVTLGVVASSTGAAIGTALIWWLGQKGMMLKPPGQKPMAIYPHLTPSLLVLAVVISAVGAMLAALYPALRASRLKPVEALRST